MDRQRIQKEKRKKIDNGQIRVKTKNKMDTKKENEHKRKN